MTSKLSNIGFIPTNTKGRMIREALTKNGGRMFSVTFIKADGTERTITGNYGHVKGQDGENTVANQEKYVTVILPEKDASGKQQRRNVNCETVKSLRINGETITFN
jgi:hypothetical protein